MIKRFFRNLTHNRRRRRIFRNLKELIMAISTPIDRHNENPKLFIWTARTADILDRQRGVTQPRFEAPLKLRFSASPDAPIDGACEGH